MSSRLREITLLEVKGDQRRVLESEVLENQSSLIFLRAEFSPRGIGLEPIFLYYGLGPSVIHVVGNYLGYLHLQLLWHHILYLIYKNTIAHLVYTFTIFCLPFFMFFWLFLF